MNVELVTLALAATLGLSQRPSPPASTGVPECDRYVAAVRECLPKMCEVDRELREMELGFTLETIAASVKAQGREAAAQACIRDIDDDTRQDLYGCFPNSPAALRKVEIRPSTTGVVIHFDIDALAGEGQADVLIASSLLEQPDAIYRVNGAKGQFSLDTHVATPLGSDAAAAPAVQLAPGTAFCYAIGTAGVGAGRRILRQGTFTTTGRAR